MARTKQLEFKKVKGWGGARRGAGRPNRSRSVNHMKRGQVRAAHPMHITMRVLDLPISLRAKRVLTAFNRASTLASTRGLRVIHFALLRNHIHLIVEADDGPALRNGMRSFGGSFGKAIRGFVGGRGAVLAGRFHLHVLKTPSELKRALRYVLLNFAKHTGAGPRIDEFSSAPFFRYWLELIGFELRGPPGASPYSAPRSWLLRVGWMRESV